MGSVTQWFPISRVPYTVCSGLSLPGCTRSPGTSKLLVVTQTRTSGDLLNPLFLSNLQLGDKECAWVAGTDSGIQETVNRTKTSRSGFAGWVLLFASYSAWATYSSQRPNCLVCKREIILVASQACCNDTRWWWVTHTQYSMMGSCFYYANRPDRSQL